MGKAPTTLITVNFMFPIYFLDNVVTTLYIFFGFHSVICLVDKFSFSF